MHDHQLDEPMSFSGGLRQQSIMFCFDYSKFYFCIDCSKYSLQLLLPFCLFSTGHENLSHNIYKTYILLKMANPRSRIDERVVLTKVFIERHFYTQIIKFMWPSWGPLGPHVGPVNVAIRDCILYIVPHSDGTLWNSHGISLSHTCSTEYSINSTFHGSVDRIFVWILLA